MAQDMRLSIKPRRNQVKIIKKRNSDQYEIVTIHNPVSFGEGFLMVIRACQLLAQETDGITLVAVAGASGAGKTVFTEKIVDFMPSVAVINMDNYKHSSRVIDGNFDDPYLIDYDKLLEDIHGLKAGKAVQVPIYDFSTSSRIGYRTIEAPSTRIVIIEGIYALSEKLRPFTNLRVSLTGGVHFGLVKRVSRDIRLAGQDPEQIIRQISKTIYPMYKAFIEPELQTAHIKVTNEFNPFSGIHNPTYILKSQKSVPVDQIKAVLLEDHWEITEETYDIYLLPPGENPEECKLYLRMRNRDGKYSLVFEEWVIDSPFIISPTITFEVSVRLLGGLMALGYTIPSILKRRSRVFSDGKVCVKTDWLEQLNRQYIQVRGRDRTYVKYIADQIGLDCSYVPRTYMEQIQLEKLVNDVMALPDDLKTKLNIDDDLALTPKEALSRASEERRREFLNRGLSHSYSKQRDKNLSKLTNLTIHNRRRNGRKETSPRHKELLAQITEQISILCGGSNDFTSPIAPTSSGNGFAPTSAKNGCAPTSSGNCFAPTSVGNGFAPTSAGNGYAPTSAGNGFPPTSVGNGFTPPSVGNGFTPTSVSNGFAPTSAGNGFASTSAGNGSAPTSAGNGSAPTSAGNGSAPTSAGNGSAPTSAGNGSAPTSSGNGSAPTSAGNGSTPTSAGNGSVPPSLLVAGLDNGSLNTSVMPTSPSFQLAKESILSEEALKQILLVSKENHRISRQIDDLNDLLREHLAERSQGRADWSMGMVAMKSIGVTLAVGGIGFMLFKTLASKR